MEVSEVHAAVPANNPVSTLHCPSPYKKWRCSSANRSIDDNVGRLLDYLESSGLAKNTLVMYTSDQGFFLGEHGWFDKRFIYEESFQMPVCRAFARPANRPVPDQGAGYRAWFGLSGRSLQRGLCTYLAGVRRSQDP